LLLSSGLARVNMETLNTLKSKHNMLFSNIQSYDGNLNLVLRIQRFRVFRISSRRLVLTIGSRAKRRLRL
jgi:hypothetical protein